MKTILITDDQAHLLIILEYNLVDLGCMMVKARSGEEALAKAQKFPIDLAIMDVDLPGINGIETVRRLKEMPGYEKLPVIVLTGGWQSDTQERARAAGASAFMNKPFSPAELTREVVKLLGIEDSAT